MPRPRSGDWLTDEISAWHREGLGVVVSLLEAHEAKELDLTEEAALCTAAGLDFLSFPIVDRGVAASLPKAMQLASGSVEKINDGSAVGIHCRAGIGRSALIAASVGVDTGNFPR